MIFRFRTVGDWLIHSPWPIRSPVLYNLRTGERVDLGLPARFGSSWRPLATEDWLVVELPELDRQDLNGDGDFEDSVLHLYNFTSRAIRNLGLVGSSSSESWSIVGDAFVFTVPERDQGRDLNDDGDVEDSIIHLHHLAENETTNLRISGHVEATSGSLIVLEVFEDGEDLNGDGDRDDNVLHVYDGASRRTTNLGLAGGWFQVSGRWLVVLDQVVHVHDLATGTKPNLGLFVEGYWGIRFWGDALLVSGREGGPGEDFNGDGDLDDVVLHRHDLRSGETRNLGVAAHINERTTVASENWFVFTVEEEAQGEDLNADGDRDDTVFHALDRRTTQTINLALAADSRSESIPDVHRISGDWLLAPTPGRDLADLSAFRSPTRFRRGDCNTDGRVDIGDASCALEWLLAGTGRPGCVAAVNANADERVDIADTVFLLNFLFGGGPPLSAPFPDCGTGTLETDQQLGCANPANCQ